VNGQASCTVCVTEGYDSEGTRQLETRKDDVDFKVRHSIVFSYIDIINKYRLSSWSSGQSL